jgi:integrase
VDALKSGYERRGYSGTSAKFLASAVRQSTGKVYDAKWKAYTRWCRDNSKDPFCRDGPQLADYFVFLFSDVGLKTSTMRGHKASILSVLKSRGHVSKSMQEDLSKLFYSFENRQGKIVKEVPKWDLGLVLQVLTNAPFEPIFTASFEHLSFKTVFLLSLATGARRGEILALRRGEFVKHSEDWSRIFLFPDPEFVPKARKATMCVDAIELKAFTEVVAKTDRDYLLCPVRALRYYLDRTAIDYIEQGRKKLFLPVNLSNHNELTANGLSKMFVLAVKSCYDYIDSSLVDQFTINIHQARLLAHSLAKAGYVSLESIMQNGHWKNHTTFSSFYLKSLAVFSQNLHSLGPVVAAGSVVQPSQQF